MNTGPQVVYVLTSAAIGNVEMATTNDSEAFCLFRDCPGIYNLHIYVGGNRVAHIAGNQ